MQIKRVIVIVLDGVGVGETPDAGSYGDKGSNSVGNTAKAIGGLHLPHMEALGLGCITEISGVSAIEDTLGAYGKMQPKSAGKDSVTGHWELMGIYLPKMLPTYPNGFPSEILKEVERRSGQTFIGNKAASGTQIIEELGGEHIRTGYPIVYTSADSVFQIAAHEAVVPVEQLYEICQIAREVLMGDHAVGRVIARPFVGDTIQGFHRTERRRDYPLKPEQPTILDKLIAAKKEVYAVGKIDDLFGGRGISKSFHTVNNEDSSLALLECLLEDFNGLLFVNLVEFDMIYGHRNDPKGYATALQSFDRYLPAIQERMRPDDLAMIVADHGVDPTTPSTDHSREYVPLLVFGQAVRGRVNLGTRQTFSDVAATIAEIFKLDPPPLGKSFLEDILEHS